MSGVHTYETCLTCGTRFRPSKGHKCGPLDIEAELKKVDECCWAADPKVLRQALTELEAARKEIRTWETEVATLNERIGQEHDELEAARRKIDKQADRLRINENKHEVQLNHAKKIIADLEEQRDRIARAHDWETFVRERQK